MRLLEADAQNGIRNYNKRKINEKFGYKSNGTLDKHVPSLRDEFLTPFDSIFDKVVNQAFPNFGQIRVNFWK